MIVAINPYRSFLQTALLSSYFKNRRSRSLSLLLLFPTGDLRLWICLHCSSRRKAGLRSPEFYFCTHLQLLFLQGSQLHYAKELEIRVFFLLPLPRLKQNAWTFALYCSSTIYTTKLCKCTRNDPVLCIQVQAKLPLLSIICVASPWNGFYATPITSHLGTGQVKPCLNT